MIQFKRVMALSLVLASLMGLLAGVPFAAVSAEGTVSDTVTDKDGNPVPADNRLMKVKVSGAGSFKAIANGDPTCLESFQQPQMHLFSGQLTVLVQSSSQPGEITVEVTGKGVKKAQLTIITE